MLKANMVPDTFNPRNQFVALSGGATAAFTYDSLGRRIQKVINGTATQYLFDAHDITQQLETLGTISYLRSLDIDEPLARGSDEFYLADALGSSIALANSDGTLSTQYSYGPFGQTAATGVATSNSFTFTSQLDDDTGLKFYRARLYSPMFHRFISEDPIGLASRSVNFYSYVGNNPILYADPSGLCADPGGGGLRYCIDSFIPHQSVLLIGKGDNRGPDPNGGTFRTRQLIRNDGSQSSEAGTSESLIPGVQLRGTLGDCGVKFFPLPLGGRKIVAQCSGTNGFGVPPWPLAYHFVILERDGKAEVVSASGTTFPSFEMWQYGDPNGPKRVYYYPTTGGVLDLRHGVKSLPLR